MNDIVGLSDLTAVKVGDPIMASRFGTAPRQYEVEAVGRKWLTAGGIQFSRETGQMKGQYSGWAVTVEEWERHTERSGIRRELRRRLDEDAAGSQPISLEQLRAIAKILEGDE